MSKKDRHLAEKYAEQVAINLGYTITRRAIRTKFQKVDFFGCDIMAMNQKGELLFIQATVGQYSAISLRRTKLKQIPWHESHTALLLVLRKFKEGRKYKYYFLTYTKPDFKDNPIVIYI
jgi:hypothetical protein